MLIQLSSLSILNRQRSEASLDKTEIGRLADSIHGADPAILRVVAKIFAAGLMKKTA